MNAMQTLCMESAGETGEVILRTPCSLGSEGWISVDERLPPPVATVIAHGRQYGDHGRRLKVYTTYTGTRVHETVEDEEITHWMPLPAAPNQAQGDKSHE